MISGDHCEYCGEWVLEPCDNETRAAACAPDALDEAPPDV